MICAALKGCSTFVLHLNLSLLCAVFHTKLTPSQGHQEVVDRSIGLLMRNHALGPSKLRQTSFIGLQSVLQFSRNQSHVAPPPAPHFVMGPHFPWNADLKESQQARGPLGCASIFCQHAHLLLRRVIATYRAQCRSDMLSLKQSSFLM